MTKEQQVAIDAMREAWPADVVERMLRAEKRVIESAIARYQRYVSGRFEEALSVARVPTGQRPRRRTLEWQAVCEEMEEAARVIPPFSPAATPSAPSTHRPASLGGETP